MANEDEVNAELDAAKQAEISQMDPVVREAVGVCAGQILQVEQRQSHLEREMKRAVDDILQRFKMQDDIDVPGMLQKIIDDRMNGWQRVEFYGAVTKAVQERQIEQDAKIAALTKLVDIDHATLTKLAGLPPRPPGDPRAN